MTDLTIKLKRVLDKNQRIKEKDLEIHGKKGNYIAGDACNNVFQALPSAGQGVEAAIH